MDVDTWTFASLSYDGRLVGLFLFFLFFSIFLTTKNRFVIKCPKTKNTKFFFVMLGMEKIFSHQMRKMIFLTKL